MAEVRYDDIEGLRSACSDDYGDWGPELEVTQAMIDEFGELTGDKQWIHCDVERAKKESPFGGPIAHGFLTLSLLPKVYPRGALTITGHKAVVNYGSDKLRFLAPVPSGAKLHARSRVAEVTQKPKGTLLCTEVAIHVVGNDKPSLLYKSLALYT